MAVLPLSLADPPRSGLGDRLSAWLALFAFAKLRGKGEAVLLPTNGWPNSTWSREANQAKDVSDALECLVLPSFASRRPIMPFENWRSVSLSKVFAPKIVLPRPTPGFPQWALPDLAYRAFGKVGADDEAAGGVADLTLPDYLAALRSVASEVTASPSCVPTAESEFWKGGAPLARIALHLRRGDAWVVGPHTNLQHAGGLHAVDDHVRDKFQRRTRSVVEAVVARLDEAFNQTQRRRAKWRASGRDNGGLADVVLPARWLILSDNRTAAEHFSRVITDASGPHAGGQRAMVAPDGVALWSLLAMRDADGIVQSTMREWSSFSAVPAILGAVPIIGVKPGRWGVLPHSRHDCVAEQFATGYEEGFAAAALARAAARRRRGSDGGAGAAATTLNCSGTSTRVWTTYYARAEAAAAAAPEGLLAAAPPSPSRDYELLDRGIFAELPATRPLTWR